MADFAMAQFRERVMDLCPPLDEREVDRIGRVTLRALADQLTRDELKWLMAELPASLASALDRGHPIEGAPSPQPTTPSREALFENVARAESVDVGVATEHAEIICRVLAELLPGELVQVLRKHLPPLSPLLEVPAPFSPGLGATPGSEIDGDLAGGRPGSRHPLAAATPESLAHEHSIARSDDPHAHRRLSSSRLPTKEREGNTLASGDAGARRRLSDGH